MSALDLHAEPRKFQKCQLFTRGLWEHLDWDGTTHSGIRALKVPFYIKMTKMLSVSLGLTKSQNWLKPPQKNNFHVFTSNPRLSEIFVNFDQVWPEVDSWEWPENLILIRPLEWVGTNVIVEMIEFPFQRLLMGQNRN